MSVPVDIFIADDSMSPAPIVGAVVTIVDPTSFVLIANATTDSSGHAAFTLPGAASPGGVTYQVRVFKLGVFFKNPFQILVFDPLPGGVFNHFTMTGTLVGVLQPATDPRCCRCTGRFVDFQNQPVPNALVRIIARSQIAGQLPKVVDGNMVSPQVLETHTDADGYVVVDLIRTAVYEVTFAGDDDTIWQILVPDRTSVNLIDLIHPQPVSLSWDPTAAPSNVVTLSIASSQALPFQVPFSVLFSDYELVTKGECAGLLNWVTFFNSDPTKALVAASDGLLYLTGTGVGTTLVTVGLVPNLIPFRVPAYSIVAPTLTINVIP